LLCGGGAEVDAYKAALSELYARTRTVVLQKPSRLKSPGIDDATFGRLAVAYGLSFGFDDLGDLRPPSSVPDVIGPDTPSSSFEDRFVSKDMV
jgi:hypothetical protein